MFLSNCGHAVGKEYGCGCLILKDLSSLNSPNVHATLDEWTCYYV